MGQWGGGMAQVRPGPRRHTVSPRASAEATSLKARALNPSVVGYVRLDAWLARSLATRSLRD